VILGCRRQAAGKADLFAIAYIDRLRKSSLEQIQRPNSCLSVGRRTVGRYIDQMRAAEAHWAQVGIQSVPSIVVNTQFPIERRLGMISTGERYG